MDVVLLPPEGSVIPWPAARSLAAFRKDRLSGTTWDGTDSEMTTLLDQVLERVHEQRSLTTRTINIPGSAIQRHSQQKGAYTVSHIG